LFSLSQLSLSSFSSFSASESVSSLLELENHLTLSSETFPCIVKLGSKEVLDLLLAVEFRIRESFSCKIVLGAEEYGQTNGI
jgi:hypothetical protein